MSRFADLKLKADSMARAGIALPRYKCHKEVYAIKIAEIVHEAPPVFPGPTCRGSYGNGTACMNCERCLWESKHLGGLGAVLVPSQEGVAPVHVDAGYLAKHKPVVGGYFVAYADGYLSFSPAKAFEDGYARI